MFAIWVNIVGCWGLRYPSRDRDMSFLKGPRVGYVCAILVHMYELYSIRGTVFDIESVYDKNLYLLSVVVLCT